MPLGLKNAPTKFQRMIGNAFRGLIGDKCFANNADVARFGKIID